MNRKNIIIGLSLVVGAAAILGVGMYVVKKKKKDEQNPVASFSSQYGSSSYVPAVHDSRTSEGEDPLDGKLHWEVGGEGKMWLEDEIVYKTMSKLDR